MSTTINNNYSQFYKGKPQSKSYSSNFAAKKDTSTNAVSSQHGKDVLVKSPENAPTPIVYTKKFMSDRPMTPEESAANEARDAAFQEEGVTQSEDTYEDTYQKIDEINTNLSWHETLREKAPEVCDEFDALMREIVDHALNHRDDGEKFADRFIEMVKKAEKALAGADSSAETADGTEAVAEESTEKASETLQEQDDDEQKEPDKEQNRSSGMVGINAGKLARMLAAAKTRSQVQAVISKIQSDLSECEAGKNNGMDVDENSVKAAKVLLQEAKSKMGSAENREATPQEEMAAAIASLM